MRKINKYLAEYALSHQNKTNKTIHVIFVPFIVLSVIGLLMCLGSFDIGSYTFDWVLLVIFAALGYYAHLSFKYFFIMTPFLFILYGLNIIFSTYTDLFYLSLALFLASWAVQFIGHKIEGKKPNFLKDLLFLLIGPIWVFKYVFRIKD